MESMKSMYENDSEFGSIWSACEQGAFNKFYRHQGFLFKETRLCILNCSFREILVHESHFWGNHGSFWHR